MNYYKTINNEGYIESISTGSGQTEITEAEYNAIMNVIMTHTETEGKGYKLKADLTWEEFDLPDPIPEEDEEISAEEALAIIRGEQ